MIKVIINADDLGYSIEVNQRIEAAIKAGAITSSTIMANGPAFEDAVRIAMQYPKISFGVHLNVIEFAPLTNVGTFRKYGMISESGEFIEGAVYVMPEYTAELKQAIYEEFNAQIIKVKQSGVGISHLDSHQHTHTIYDLRNVIMQLMTRHDVNKVRRCLIPSIRLMLWGQKGNAIKLDKSKAVTPKKRNVLWRRWHLFVVKYQCARWIRSFRSVSTITDGFYAYHTVYDNWNILKSNIEGRCVELMCHPGHPAYEAETQSIMNKALDALTDVRYINYNEL